MASQEVVQKDMYGVAIPTAVILTFAREKFMIVNDSSVMIAESRLVRARHLNG